MPPQNLPGPSTMPPLFIAAALAEAGADVELADRNEAGNERSSGKHRRL
jgi:hypothetical protein